MLEDVDDNGEPRLGFVQVKKFKNRIDPFFVNPILSFQPRTFVQVGKSKKCKF